ncbi:MAG: YigZ family protein [Oligoflexales bacterium]
MQIFAHPCQIELVEKKSRFIAIARSVRSEKEFSDELREIEAEYPDASHIVYAYRIQEDSGALKVRAFDAGEPKSTAGKPILAHLEGNDLINSVVFVVRYFGGIKLGAGGLVRAYSRAAKILVSSAVIVPYVIKVMRTCKMSHAEYPSFERRLKAVGGEICDKSFSDEIVCKILIPELHADAFTEWSSP